jgi:hypothetical protein
MCLCGSSSTTEQVESRPKLIGGRSKSRLA